MVMVAAWSVACTSGAPEGTLASGDSPAQATAPSAGTPSPPADISSAASSGIRGTKPPTSAPVAGSTPGVAAQCHTAVRSLGALRDPGRTGGFAFGDAENVAGAPSLYLTAWSMLFAQQTGIPMQVAVRARVVRYLADQLGRTAEHDEAGLSPLTRLDAVSRALAALGVSIPLSTVAVVAGHRSGGGYRDDTAGGVTPVATYLAVLTLSRMHADIPAEVTAAVAKQVPTLNSAATPDAIAESQVPLLGAAAAVGMDKVGLSRSTVQSLLGAWAKIALDAGPSPVGLGLLASMGEIARVTGVAAPTVPREYVEGLRTPSEYLGVEGGPGKSGDPQVSYNGAQVGATFGSQAVRTLLVGQVPQGWLGDVTAISVDSTYHALGIEKACGVEMNKSGLADQVKQWWSTLLAGSGSAINVEDAGQAAKLCWISDAIGRDDLATAGRTALKAAVDAAALAAPDLRTAGPLAAAYTVCRLTVPADVRARLAAKAVGPATDAQLAYLQQLVGRWAGSEPLVASSKKVLTTLRTADGYRWRPGLPTTDVVSTAWGAAVFGTESTGAGAFQTEWGAAAQPVTGDGKASVSLVSLHAGLAIVAPTRMGPLLLP